MFRYKSPIFRAGMFLRNKVQSTVAGFNHDLSSVELQISLDCFQSHSEKKHHIVAVRKRILSKSHYLTATPSHCSPQPGAAHSPMMRHKSHRGAACPTSTMKTEHPLLASYLIAHSTSSSALGKNKSF